MTGIDVEKQRYPVMRHLKFSTWNATTDRLNTSDTQEFG